MIIEPEKAPNSQFCRLWTRAGAANPWPQCNLAETQTEKEKIACKLRQRQNKSTPNSEYQLESPSLETTKTTPAPTRRTCPRSGRRRECRWRCSRSGAGSRTWHYKRSEGEARTDRRWRQGRNWGHWWVAARWGGHCGGGHRGRRRRMPQRRSRLKGGKRGRENTGKWWKVSSWWQPFAVERGF